MASILILVKPNAVKLKPFYFIISFEGASIYDN